MIVMVTIPSQAFHSSPWIYFCFCMKILNINLHALVIKKKVWLSIWLSENETRAGCWQRKVWCVKWVWKLWMFEAYTSLWYSASTLPRNSLFAYLSASIEQTRTSGTEVRLDCWMLQGEDRIPLSCRTGAMWTRVDPELLFHPLCHFIYIFTALTNRNVLGCANIYITVKHCFIAHMSQLPLKSCI